MMIWIYIGLGLTVLWIIILISYIQINLQYSRKESDDNVHYEMKAILGIIRIHLEIPKLKLEGIEQGLEYETDIDMESMDKEMADIKDDVTSKKAMEFYRHFQLLKNHVFRFSEWMKDSSAHIKCTHFRWNTQIGVGDAPETAVTTGMVWALKSSMAGFLFNRISLETKPQLQVTPQYNQLYFATEVDCKFRIRHFHAFMAPVHLLIRIMKIKGGLKVWFSFLYKAYSVWKRSKKQKAAKQEA
jgi:hypothetical protein